ncbi:Protein Wnt-4 [Aphelenchoides bicaudatus]|nr:Protein Wnt-4 [Aphelenchoides bicaudatus]
MLLLSWSSLKCISGVLVYGTIKSEIGITLNKTCTFRMFFALADAYISSSYQKSYFDCNSLPGLTRKQLEICKRNKFTMSIIFNELKNISEVCKEQFMNEKWNCPLNHHLGIMPSKTANKESAYVHALFAGAVSHAVATACAKGQIAECQCGDQPHGAAQDSDFVWAGCADNVRYGNYFSRRFVDAAEKHKMDSKSLMHLHNNRVGRKVLASSMYTNCRCHGVSGSCVTKTCYKKLPDLDKFARILKRKYEHAQQVTIMPDKEGLILKPISRTERYINARLSSTPIPAFKYSTNMQTPANKGELVFLDESPDYCMPDPKQDIRGTSGRECFSEDQCHELCCGRGWKVINKWKEENCNCRLVQKTFQVECNVCTKLEQRKYCR